MMMMMNEELTQTPPTHCELMTDGFGRALQFVLGLIAIATLLLKREAERPMRPFQIWLFDVSKQGTGAMIIHFINIGLSVVFASSKSAPADECGLYFFHFVIDVTLGVAIVATLIKQSEALAVKYGVDELKETGQYGSPPQVRMWLYQLTSYLSILLVMKLIVTLIIFIFYDILAYLSVAIFSMFETRRHLELLVVMILGPCFLNAFQFWIVDTLLKKKEKPEALNNDDEELLMTIND